MKNYYILIKNGFITIEKSDNIFFNSKLSLNLNENIIFVKNFIDNKYLNKYPLTLKKILTYSKNSFHIIELNHNYVYEHKDKKIKTQIYKNILINQIKFIEKNYISNKNKIETLKSDNKKINFLIDIINKLKISFPNLIKIENENTQDLNFFDLENLLKTFIKSVYLNDKDKVIIIEKILNPEYFLIIPKENEIFDSNLYLGKDIKVQGKKCGLVNKAIKLGIKEKTGKVLVKAFVEVTL